MLPRAHRMVDPDDFRLTFRQGKRAGDRFLIVHARTDEGQLNSLVGFVVPKKEIKLATGRNRVKRQLRHLMRDRLDTLPDGSRIVVRASSQALGCTSDELATHLDSALHRAWKKWDAR